MGTFTWPLPSNLLRELGIAPLLSIAAGSATTGGVEEKDIRICDT